jgi:hypothetical protein
MLSHVPALLVCRQGGLGTWPNLWLEIFNVLIAGAAVDPELFAFNPWGVAMMCTPRSNASNRAAWIGAIPFIALPFYDALI